MSSPKPKILLVDDEPRFVTSLASLLEHYGYCCVKALNGSEAIEQLKLDHFEIALLDIALPDMSGCDLARFAKAHCQSTVVIMLTGINTAEVAVQAMKLGAYDFLSKPINYELLSRVLERALQHNRLEQKLRLSEERFKILTEAAWEGIAIHDEGRIVEANDQFLRIFGYSQEDLREGLFISDCLAAKTRSASLEILERGDDCRCTTTGLRKDGSDLPIEVKSCPITFLHKPHRVFVVRDRLEQVRAEEEKIALQKKLSAASKLNALGLMAGSIAHDLNNILSGIVSYPDLLLLQMNKSDKHYGQIEKIKQAGKRAAAVVSDLLAITRSGTQKKVAANLNDIVEDYLKSLEHGQRMAFFPRVSILTTLAKDLCNSCCIPQQLHKLLLNLIGNALEAVPADGIIEISTENCRFTHPLHVRPQLAEDCNYVKLVIADNGQGIKKEEVEHIFDPFYTTKVMGKSGTGLGLSIVWRIVQDHEGWIEVKDNAPGTSFEIFLPATADSHQPVSSSIVQNLQKGCGESILIVDDQADQNHILQEALTKMGYRAFSVISGELAIEFVERQPVDLLLLDMMMGDGLNGSETLEIIQKSFPSQKAIVISGYARKEEIDKAKELGVSTFLDKPVTISELLIAIRNNLAQGAEQVPITGA